MINHSESFHKYPVKLSSHYYRWGGGRAQVHWISGSLSDQKPPIELITYLTCVVNFGEVRKAQLAKYTPLTSTIGPLGSFQIYYGLFRC